MSFDNTWHTADPDAVGNIDNGEPPDPGTYDVILIDASAFTSKKQEDWVALKWQLVGSEHFWTVLLGFRSEAAANFTKRECRQIGVDVARVASLDDLDQALREHVAKFFQVEVVQNGEFRNTYVRGRASDIPADGSEFAPAMANGPVADEDDIPF